MDCKAQKNENKNSLVRGCLQAMKAANALEESSQACHATATQSPVCKIRCTTCLAELLAV